MNQLSDINKQPKIDVIFIIAACSLLLIGIIMSFSSTIDIATKNLNSPFYYLIKHFAYLLISMMVAFAVYFISLSWWKNNSINLLLVAWLLLVVVLVLGKTINGSTRWLSLGPVNFQPSELAKLFLVVYLASYLARYPASLRHSWWGFLKPIIILIITSFLLLAEPDFGATVVIAFTFMGLLFLSGVKLTQFSIICIAGTSAIIALIWMEPYRLIRLLTFLDPFKFPYDEGYQLVNALIAYGRGAIVGLGLGNSIQKLEFLPEAHTDFVFSVIAEEFGLIGSLTVIILFSVLVYRIFVIGKKAANKGLHFEAYFVWGIALLFALQAFFNIGVNMGLLPTKGLTLPLVSYGGSSLLVNCTCLALVARVNYDTTNLQPREEDSFVKPP